MKERREQWIEKANPPMIASAKNYTKKKKGKYTERTLEQMVKAKVYRQKSQKKHTHTHSQKEKNPKKVYIFKKKREESNQINI